MITCNKSPNDTEAGIVRENFFLKMLEHILQLHHLHIHSHFKNTIKKKNFTIMIHITTQGSY